MSIILEGVTKRFGGQLIVDHVSLEVYDGELFVLLGASGSGKSTILRQIAGLLPVDGGRISLHGRDVTTLPPQRRGTGFVFQNYSIFRHMSVAENIEFGLKIRKVPATERVRRRNELLELVGLAGLGERYSHQLSGGQQQRVALARALAYEPNVLLLDEPFGALDVKIRTLLRRSLKQVQRQLGITTILVTHDQEEAFELADRIGVIERGKLLEVDGPERLYARPRTTFVATFLGAGTVLAGRQDTIGARFGPVVVPLPESLRVDVGQRVQMMFRPEDVVLTPDPPPEGQVVLGQGEIVENTFAGGVRRMRLRLPRLGEVRQISPVLPFGEEGLLVDCLVPAGISLAGDRPWVSLRRWHLIQPADFNVLLLLTDRDDWDAPSMHLATNLGAGLEASLRILTVAPDAQLLEALRDRVQKGLPAEGGPPTVILRQGDPVQELAAEQATDQYELLILPVPATGLRADPVLGELLERMNGAWLTPVLLLRGELAAIGRILICTAAGEPGKSDVRFGGWLARRLGAAVTLLYITSAGEEPLPAAASHLDAAAVTLRNLDVSSTVRIREDFSAVDGILAEIEEGHFDCVVLGSHGPQARSILGLDDITFQVVIRSRISVLIVPGDSV